MTAIQFSTPNPGSVSAQAKRYLHTLLRNGTASMAATPPAVRAGTYVASSQTATGSSQTHVLSSSITAGDLIVVVRTWYSSSANDSWTLPAGWWRVYGNTSTILCYAVYAKTAVAGDVGSTLTFTLSSNASVQSIISFSVSGCEDLSCITNLSVSANLSTGTAPAIPATNNGFANSLGVTIYSVCGTGGGAPTYTATPGTAIGQNSVYSSANTAYAVVAASSQSLAAAGAWASQTATLSSGAGASYQWALSLVFSPASVSGTPPSGGWNLVDEYGDSQLANAYPSQTLFHVWQSPSGSNNQGVTYYVVIASSIQVTTYTSFGIALCELYTAASHTCQGLAMDNYMAPTASLPNAGTTPPWCSSQASATLATMLGVSYPPGSANAPVMWGNLGPQNGTNNWIFIANADGIFLANGFGTPTSNTWCYVGSFTSIVQNAALPNPDICLGVCNQANTFGTSSPYNISCALTRDYVINSFTHLNTYPFSFAMGYYAIQMAGITSIYAGVGQLGMPDLYAVASALNSQPPTLLRIVLGKATVTFNAANQRADWSGALRALLPAWILTDTTRNASVLFGDTVQVGTDTYGAVVGMTGMPVYADLAA